MRSLFIASLIIIAGCAKTVQQPTIAKTLPQQDKTTLSDQKSDLKLISHDNWSFAVPSSYQEVDITDANKNAGVKALVKSNDDHTVLLFGSEKTDMNVVDYTYQIGKIIQEHGMEIENVYNGQISNRDGKLILFSASPETAGMDFITLVDGIVYVLSCYSLIDDLVNKTCLKIASTIDIK